MTATGEMRTRVYVEQNSPTKDTTGQMIEHWASLGQRWAKISPVGGREVFASQQVQQLVTHLVRMRYWSAVTAGCRLRSETRILHIDSVVDVDERHKELELRCIERVN